VEYRPLTVDLRDAAAAFAARMPESDKGHGDPFLIHDVVVASWTRATPAKRIAAVDGDEIVGLLTVDPQHGWMDHVGQIRVVVQPSARGHGVGRTLIERGIELAASMGLSKLSADIMATNEPGVAMFERNGFHREAILTRHVRDGDGQLQDLVVLAYELEPTASPAEHARQNAR
jgi:ribosomal protein S18 acetylase RimI-like enzyme